MKTNKHVVIIGAGLSGLTLAYLLQRANLNVTVLEASSRLGGRILTQKGILGTSLELGATWFSDLHPQLKALVEEVGLQKFPQYAKGISFFQTKSFEPAQQFAVPESESPSYRVAGGTQMLIDALELRLNIGQVHRNMKVISVEETSDGLVAGTTNGEKYKADIVVSCIPPELVSYVKCSPMLPAVVRDFLPTVHTWMAGAIKFVLEYASPFWRQKGFSGMLYSHAGIITEMYDHTNFEGNRFGFTGFLNPGAASYTQQVRKELVLDQLAGLMGDEARQLSTYEDKVWNGEHLQVDNSPIYRPHQNNGHSLLQVPYLNGKFYFCGTESSTDCSGYMEGAVNAAKVVAQRILSQDKKTY